MLRLYFRLVCFGLLGMALLSSCQKDENVKDLTAGAAVSADTSQKINDLAAPGNYLVSKGTLKIKLPDTTFTFDAAQDSIAFVNMNIDGKEYYGVTAINKAHTVSFGVSSLGAPIAEMTSSIAGCQLLLHPSDKTSTEYTLTKNTTPQDFGTMLLDKYNQDTVLAKGTFHTFLAKDPKKNTPAIVEGSFELKVR